MQIQPLPDDDLDPRDRGGQAQPLLIVEGLRKFFRVKTQDGKPAAVKAREPCSPKVTTTSSQLGRAKRSDGNDTRQPLEIDYVAQPVLRTG